MNDLPALSWEALIEYIKAHPIQLLGSYLAIVCDALRREINREQAAKRAYFYRLCDYIANTHNMLPSPASLKEMKKHFAKQFNVEPECFPSKNKASEALLLFLEATTRFPWSMKSLIYENFEFLKSRFEENDQVLESPLLHPINLISTRHVFWTYCVVYSMIMVIATISNPPVNSSLCELYIFALSTIATIALVSGVSTIFYFLFVVTHKLVKKIYWTAIRRS